MKKYVQLLKSEIKFNHDKISNVDLTDEAYRHKTYRDWLNKYCEAEKDYNLCRDKYNNFIALKDMRITEESSARYLINKKIQCVIYFWFYLFFWFLVKVLSLIPKQV